MQPDPASVLRDTCFVTGADSNYFWLVSAAVQSVREQAPELDVRVMDFGFTEPQARFLSEQGLLLPRPAELPQNLHPYTLKTLFVSYVRDLKHRNFAWFDSDMLCVDPDFRSVAVELAMMDTSAIFVAACPDMGPNPTLDRFAKAFQAPALSRFVSENPELADKPYLNTGFILFSNASAFLAKWPRVASRMPGEICIDQNAFNILFYSNEETGRILDPRRWNVHSNLLPNVEQGSGSLRCEDQKIALLHCTSHRNVHHEELAIQLKVAETETQVRFKTFRNPALRQGHLATLVRFARQHAPQLKAHGIV